MKRSSVVVTSIGLLILSIAVVMSNCGGGGGGGGPTLQPPAYNLTGNWQETQTVSQTDSCGLPGLNHQWTMSQQSGSNTVTLGPLGQPATINMTMSGNTLTFSGPLDLGIQNVSCNQFFTLTFTSATHGSGSNTVKCSDNIGNSRTEVFNEIFDKI